MLQRVPDAGSASSNTALGSGTDCREIPGHQTIAPGSGGESDEWFFHVAWAVYGKDPGQQLHYVTGYPLSTCRAYVEKSPDKRRRPNPHFLRKLFHHPQGAPFHKAFMEGCTAQWWLELDEQRRVGARTLTVVKEETAHGQ